MFKMDMSIVKKSHKKITSEHMERIPFTIIAKQMYVYYTRIKRNKMNI